MKKILSAFLCLFMAWLGAQTTITVGAGSLTGAGTDHQNPFYRSFNTSSYHYSKSVQLLTQADIGYIGTGAVVNSVAYHKATGTIIAGTNAYTIKIYAKNSNATSLASGTSWADMKTGAVLFHESTIDANNNLPSSPGWMTFANNTGNTFTYNGNSVEFLIEWSPVTNTLSSPFSTGPVTFKYDAVSAHQAIGIANNADIPDTYTDFNTASLRRYQTQLNVTMLPCSGTPAPGNTVSSVVSTCPGDYATTFSLENFTAGGGVTYQWYKNGNPIVGATMSTLDETITGADTYHCDVTCGGVTTSSTPITMTHTTQGISTFPWTENFDAMSTLGAGVLPNCWLNVTGTRPWVSTDTTQNTSPRSGANYVRLQYGNANASQLWTPMFNLQAGVTYEFSFYAYTGTSTATGWTGNVVVNNVQSMTNATDLGTFITSSQTITPYTKQVIYFTPATTGGYYFALNVSSTTAPWYLAVDDFELKEAGTCPAPTLTAVTNITANSATLNWTGIATGYEYVVSTTNTPPAASGTAITGTTIDLTALTPATTYYYWVRSVCTGETSSWEQDSFSTLPPPPANDDCSNAINVANFPYTNTQVDASESTNNAGFIDACNSGMNDGVWYKFVGDGSSHTINITNVQSDFDVELQVYSGSCGAFTCVARADSRGNGGNETVTFPTTAGTEYFVNVGHFHATEDRPEGDFTIEITREQMATNEVNGKVQGVTIAPNPFVDVVRFDGADVKSVVATDVAGRKVAELPVEGNVANLGGLTPGMYILVLKHKDGSTSTVKAIKK